MGALDCPIPGAMAQRAQSSGSWEGAHSEPFNFVLLGLSSLLSWASLAQMVKNPPANSGDVGSVLGLRRSPGEGNGYPLQYSCLESPMDRGAWWATVYGVTKSQDTTGRLTLPCL